MRPIRLPTCSVNQRLPSGPAVMPAGSLPALMPTGNSVITPAVVMRPIRFADELGEPEVAVRPRRCRPEPHTCPRGADRELGHLDRLGPSGERAQREAAEGRRRSEGAGGDARDGGLLDVGDRSGAELNQITTAVWETAPVDLDWGDGDYARTAALLAPAAEVLVDAAGVAPGARVLDVACGTGTAALIAAARGGRVTGVDASPGLVELAAERSRAAGAEARFVTGRAESLPVDDARVRRRPELLRGDLRGGRPRGRRARWCAPPGRGRRRAHELAARRARSARCRRSCAARSPSRRAIPPRWGDPDWVAPLLIAAGADEVRVEDGEIAFRDASPEAWLAEQEEHHPVWRWARRDARPGGLGAGARGDDRGARRGQRGPRRVPHHEPLPGRARHPGPAAPAPRPFSPRGRSARPAPRQLVDFS